MFLHSVPIEGDPLWFRGETYYPYHFNCKACGVELDSTAREVKTRPGYTAQELVRQTEINIRVESRRNQCSSRFKTLLTFRLMNQKKQFLFTKKAIISMM